MTEDDKVEFKSKITCRFCEKEFFSIKLRNHCLLTGKKRRPALSKGNFNVRQSQSNFIPIKFHKFGILDCHLLF